MKRILIAALAFLPLSSYAMTAEQSEVFKQFHIDADMMEHAYQRCYSVIGTGNEAGYCANIRDRMNRVQSNFKRLQKLNLPEPEKSGVIAVHNKVVAQWPSMDMVLEQAGE
ncbi:hypothetical protein R84981_002896 [Carnimonas sp. R-84981]|uniref:hypothetical protein n=1 Tax=Carnimonas bestiolae TaxID=3402172 RepID=UPI003EDC80B0